MNEAPETPVRQFTLADLKTLDIEVDAVVISRQNLGFLVQTIRRLATELEMAQAKPESVE